MTHSTPKTQNTCLKCGSDDLHEHNSVSYACLCCGFSERHSPEEADLIESLINRIQIMERQEETNYRKDMIREVRKSKMPKNDDNSNLF